MDFFVGIDWGSRVHNACVLSCDGELKAEWEFEHSGDGVSGCVDKLVSMAGGAKQLQVAIEVPHGAVVEALVDRDIAVFSINPKQLDRFRDRHSLAGAKDDDRDAYVLADSLRTDMKLFRRVQPSEPELIALRDMSRLYESLTEQVIALSNQIWHQLQRYYVQLRDLGRWHEEPWLWDLFEKAPTPQKLETLQVKHVKAILKEHRIRRYKPLQLVDLLQQQKSLKVAPGVAESASERVSLQLPILRQMHKQRRTVQKRMATLLKQMSAPSDDNDEQTHRDAALLLSLPGLGERTGATMLAEADFALQRRDYQDLRRLCGVAPVSKRTGGKKRKKPHVVMRRACNTRLRDAIHQWAKVATQVDDRTKQHYARLRAAGHSHGRALRGVGDRLLKVLVSILSSGKMYDSQIRNHKGALAA